MSEITIHAHQAGGVQHVDDCAGLAATGVRLPAAHRPNGRPASSDHDVWCAVRDAEGALIAGVVVSVQSSRKIPWLRLGRIHHAARWLDALHASHVTDPVATLQRALRHADRRLALVSAHAYRLDEPALAALEQRLAAAGWVREASERSYQRTSLVSLAGDTEALLARLAYSARRGIRGVEKGGWRVERIQDPAHAPRLQWLHEQAHDRTGGQAVRLDLAGAVTASLADPTASVLFGVFHPERTGPEALVGFVHGIVADDAVVYSTAGTERADDIGAAPLGYGLVWALMQWGQALGLRWYDFGGITPPDEPGHPLARISEFKRKFRGEELRNASDWSLPISPTQANLLVLAEKAIARVRAS